MDAERLLATSEAALEYAALRAEGHCPAGIYILPSVDSLLVWDGVLFVHKGYYADAVLPFRVRLPLSYPQRAPELSFGGKDTLFHPLVDPSTGMLNVQARFSPWRPKEDRVFHLLHWAKSIFKKDVLDKLEEDDCLNKEAFKYRDSPMSFASLSAQAAALSKSAPALFAAAGPTPRGITFREVEGGEAEVDGMRRRAGVKAWTGSGSVNVAREA